MGFSEWYSKVPPLAGETVWESHGNCSHWYARFMCLMERTYGLAYVISISKVHEHQGVIVDLDLHHDGACWVQPYESGYIRQEYDEIKHQIPRFIYEGLGSLLKARFTGKETDPPKRRARKQAPGQQDLFCQQTSLL